MEGGGVGPVPLTIISGFLGAGKTTVINNLVQKRESDCGTRTGLLVNDFAEVNIDAELIRSSFKDGHEALVELSNGCVCCTISGELEHSIEKVLDCGVDHIIVETSGVSDPRTIVATLLLPQLRKHVWLSGLVVVVDGESIRDTLETSASARNQLKQADVVVINKTDLLTSDQYEEVKETIKGAAPEQFNIIPSQYGNIPAAVIYGLDSMAEESGKKGNHHHHSLWHGGGSQPQNHKEEIEGLRTVSYRRLGVTFNLGKFQRFMARRFPPGVIRAKGFLCFDCAPSKRYVLQLSGKRRFDASDLDLAGGGTAAEEDRKIEFVFIGSGLDADAIIHDLDSCRQDREDGPGATTGEEEGERRVRDASELREFISRDVRFQVEGDPESGALRSLVLFRLRHSRWHGMSVSDMNRALLSTFNSTSGESKLFMTHQTAAGVDSFALRLDTSGCEPAGARDIWLEIQRATEAMLTNVFMSTFCCGIR